MNRFAKALKSWHRVGELVRCARAVDDFAVVTAAFLGLRKLSYPQQFRHRSGYVLTVYDFEDLTTLWAVWCAGEYDVPADARVIVDAGANIGAFSLFGLARAPGAMMVALEPFPSTFAKLLAAVSTNRLSGRAFCHPVALAPGPMTLFMDASPDIKSHSRKARPDDPPVEAVAVDGWGLEQVLAAHGLAEIDYLKIDIEGGEVPFFEAVDPELLRRVKKVGVECHSRQGRDIVWQRLERARFKLARVSRGGAAASTAEFVRA